MSANCCAVPVCARSLAVGCTAGTTVLIGVSVLLTRSVWWWCPRVQCRSYLFPKRCSASAQEMGKHFKTAYTKHFLGPFMKRKAGSDSFFFFLSNLPLFLIVLLSFFSLLSLFTFYFAPSSCPLVS